MGGSGVGVGCGEGRAEGIDAMVSGVGVGDEVATMVGRITVSAGCEVGVGEGDKRVGVGVIGTLAPSSTASGVGVGGWLGIKPGRSDGDPTSTNRRGAPPMKQPGP